MSRKTIEDYIVFGRSAASQPAQSRAALNVHVLVPLDPAVAWMSSATSKRRAPVSTACDMPVGEVSVTDVELTLMQPTSIAFGVVVVTSGTDPEDAAAPDADFADVSRPLAPE
jgi:hypothetical protein